MPVDATVETFSDLTREGNVLVDFWGPRCQPCLAMMPTIAGLENAADGAGLGRVRVQDLRPQPADQLHDARDRQRGATLESCGEQDLGSVR